MFACSTVYPEKSTKTSSWHINRTSTCEDRGYHSQHLEMCGWHMAHWIAIIAKIIAKAALEFSSLWSGTKKTDPMSEGLQSEQYLTDLYLRDLVQYNTFIQICRIYFELRWTDKSPKFLCSCKYKVFKNPKAKPPIWDVSKFFATYSISINNIFQISRYTIWYCFVQFRDSSI